MIKKLTVAIGFTTILGGIHAGHSLTNDDIILNHQYRGIRLALPLPLQFQGDRKAIKKRIKALRATRRAERRKVRAIRKTERRAIRAQRKYGYIAFSPPVDQFFAFPIQQVLVPLPPVVKQTPSLGNGANFKKESIKLPQKETWEEEKSSSFISRISQDSIVEKNSEIEPINGLSQKESREEERNSSLISRIFQESIAEKNSEIEPVNGLSQKESREEEISSAFVPLVFQNPTNEKMTEEEPTIRSILMEDSSTISVSNGISIGESNQFESELFQERFGRAPISQNAYVDSDLLETKFESLKTLINDTNSAVDELDSPLRKFAFSYFSPMSDAEELERLKEKFEDLVNQFGVVQQGLVSLDSDLEGAEQQDLDYYHEGIRKINDLINELNNKFYEANTNLSILESKVEMFVLSTLTNKQRTVNSQEIDTTPQASSDAIVDAPQISNENSANPLSQDEILDELERLLKEELVEGKESSPSINESSDHPLSKDEIINLLHNILSGVEDLNLSPFLGENSVVPVSQRQILSEEPLSLSKAQFSLDGANSLSSKDVDTNQKEITSTKSAPPVFLSIKPWLKHATEKQEIIPKESFTQIINLLSPVIDELGKKLDVLNIDTFKQSRAVSETIEKIIKWTNNLQGTLYTIERNFVNSSPLSLRLMPNEDNLDFKSIFEKLKSNIKIASILPLDDSKVGVPLFHTNIFFLNGFATYLSEECCELINMLEKKSKKPKYQMKASTLNITAQSPIIDIRSFMRNEVHLLEDGLRKNLSSAQEEDKEEEDFGFYKLNAD